MMSFVRTITTYLTMLLLALACTSASLRAQGMATLRGTVTDASGAVVPQATVAVTQVGTGQSRSVSTARGRRSSGVAASALTAGTGSAGVTGGGPHPEWMAPPGYMSKQAKTGNMARERRMSEGSYDAATRAGLIVTGSPKMIIQKFKHIIDRTDPGYLTFWAREGKKPHEATMRGIELLGKEVIPALREHQSALVTGREVTPWPQ